MSFYLSAFWAVLELLSFHFFCKSFLPIQVSKKAYAISFVIAWLCSMGYLGLKLGDIPELILAIVMFTTLAFINFRGSIFRKVTISMMALVFGAVIDTLFPYGASAVLGISVSDLVWRKMTYCIVVTLGKSISILISWLIGKIRKNNAQEPLQQKWLLLILLFPTVSLIALVIVHLGYQESEDLSMSAVWLSVLFIVANAAILYLIHQLEKHTSETKEQALLKQQMEIQTESIQALEKSHRAQRKSIHEHRNQLQTICDLLEQGKFEAAQAYIKQLQGIQTTRVFAVNTHHPIVDAVLNHKYQIARERGISFEIQVNDLSHLSISTDILVVLLSNLLDNAIEACAHVKADKEMQFTMLIEDALFLSIRNTSLPVKIDNNMIHTTKNNKANHGYGLQQIRQILDNEKAEYSLSYEDGWFQFVAEIPLL